MKYVVVDLEMNPVNREYKEEWECCKSEIIEIGAVVLDEDYVEIGSFMTLVKPRYNHKILKNITRLTGITTEVVKDAPCFEDAMDMFFKWCESIPGEIQICQWSESDWDQVTKEMELKEYVMIDEEEMIMSDWCDFQKEYDEKLGLEQRVSLKNALSYAGVDFAGRQHDALFDARNTAKLLGILRTPNLCKKHLESVIDALTPKTVSLSLGDMFDLGELLVSA